MQKTFYTTLFTDSLCPNKLTEIIELIVQSENLRLSPSVCDEFKSFNLNMREDIYMS